MKSKKKIWIIAIIGLLIIATIYYIAVQKVSDDNMHIVKLDNGDKITFNIGGDPFVPYDNLDESVPTFTMLSDKDFAAKFPELVKDKNSPCLPKEAKKLRHSYQMLADKNGKPFGDYDEIYQWETSIYNSAKKGNIYIIRNSGNKEVTQDRGYIELSLYHDHPKRFRQSEIVPSIMGMRDAESFLNGTRLIVYENMDNVSSDRSTYTARIISINGSGVDAYLMADNVSQDDFISVLKALLC